LRFECWKTEKTQLRCWNKIYFNALLEKGVDVGQRIVLIEWERIQPNPTSSASASHILHIRRVHLAQPTDISRDQKAQGCMFQLHTPTWSHCTSNNSVSNYVAVQTAGYNCIFQICTSSSTNCQHAPIIKFQLPAIILQSVSLALAASVERQMLCQFSAHIVLDLWAAHPRNFRAFFQRHLVLLTILTDQTFDFTTTQITQAMFGQYHSSLCFAFLVNILPALSLTYGLPAAPAARIVVPRALPTSWSLPHRVSAGASTSHQSSLRRNTNLSNRQAGQQVPFQWCPEFFGNSPKLCSQCGGDTQVKGTCDDILVSGPQVHCGPVSLDGCLGYYCKCSDDGGPDNSPKVTSTTVIDGQTATVVWEPITLTEYKSLRASTTVTLSETATTSSASEVESVVAIIFAGGVAWAISGEYFSNVQSSLSCLK
jgi:hypothetical protein